ncbi:uncharacterized protein LOC120609693 isoform X1 [Pteropus medius]|uniref:uncharacterized protein LOC120609693 isoform X1 n=1 Tax=Pteropus vampyrus TaxID=132908 RepID=UPI00196A7F65|nr:uncharacterized protein LOC120609693 isoform X1 [Pteropus giganteus]
MSSSHGVHGRGKGGTNCEEPTSQCRCGGRRATSHSRKTLSSEATPGGHSLRLNQTLSLLGQRTRSAGRRRGHQEVEHSSKEPSGIDPPLSPTAPQLPLSIQRKKSLGESWPIPKESGECFGAHSSPPVQLHGGEEVDCQQSGHSSKSGEKCHLMDRHIRLELKAGLCLAGLESRKAGSARSDPRTTLLHMKSLFLVLLELLDVFQQRWILSRFICILIYVYRSMSFSTCVDSHTHHRKKDTGQIHRPQDSCFPL